MRPLPGLFTTVPVVLNFLTIPLTIDMGRCASGYFLIAIALLVKVDTHLPYLNSVFLCLSHVEEKWPLCHVIFKPQGNRMLRITN